MSTCLLIIDAQASFTRRPYFTPDDLPAYLQAQNALIAGAQAANLPIVQVFHTSGRDDPEDAFSPASGLVRPLEGLLPYEPALTVHKTRHSALVGTGLDVWLVQHGLRQLIVSGIRTEQCCETTTRHASDLGWSPLFVPEATLTWAMTQPDGRSLSAAEISSRTATVLDGRFARVCSVAEALERAGAH